MSVVCCTVHRPNEPEVPPVRAGAAAPGRGDRNLRHLRQPRPHPPGPGSAPRRPVRGPGGCAGSRAAGAGADLHRDCARHPLPLLGCRRHRSTCRQQCRERADGRGLARPVRTVIAAGTTETEWPESIVVDSTECQHTNPKTGKAEQLFSRRTRPTTGWTSCAHCRGGRRSVGSAERRRGHVQRRDVTNAGRL